MYLCLFMELGEVITSFCPGYTCPQLLVPSAHGPLGAAGLSATDPV